MLSAPQVIRLEMVQGNTAPLYIALNNNCCQFNLTGATVWFTVKRFPTDLDVLAIIRKIYPASLAIADAVSGLVKISFNVLDTSLLPPWFQDYAWDLQIKDANGIYLTGLNGTLGIYPSYTQAK